MTRVYLVIGIFLLFSCEQKDEKFCNCLSVGEELNDFSAELLLRDATLSDKKKMDKLKAAKKKACISFETMSGTEMLKKKEMCTE